MKFPSLKIGRLAPRYPIIQGGMAIRVSTAPLATAVANATTRSIGKSGAVGWNPMGSDIDISPLVACTLALYGTTITKRDPDRVQEVMIG